MFGRKHHQKRSTNIVIVIFRLLLSIVMFIVLLAGVYTAYKKFSGFDPLQLDPLAILNSVLAGKIPSNLTSFKLDSKILGRTIATNSPSEDEPVVESSSEPVSGNFLFRFLVVTDSHNDNESLTRVIAQAKAGYPDLKFIIGLGDYTEVGTIEELKKAKAVFDGSALRYFLIPGDHDLWDCRNRGLVPVACFEEVFGSSYQSFTFNNFEILLLNNSDNYKGLGEEQKQWIEAELEKTKEDPPRGGVLVFLHEPLFHSSSDRMMGKTEVSIKQQAKDLTFQLKEAGVKKVFAGDTHLFSQYSEPVTDLAMVTIGAVSIERNPQPPRFAIVSVMDNGEIGVEDVEIK